MIVIGQMMPGMEWIPLIAILFGVGLLVAISTSIFFCVRKVCPNDKMGVGACATIVIACLFIIRLLLPKPVSESRVIETVNPGMTVEALVAKIGSRMKDICQRTVPVPCTTTPTILGTQE